MEGCSTYFQIQRVFKLKIFLISIGSSDFFRAVGICLFIFLEKKLNFVGTRPFDLDLFVFS